MIAFTTEQWSAWLAEVTTDRLTNTNGAVTVTAAPGTWALDIPAGGVTRQVGPTVWGSNCFSLPSSAATPGLSQVRRGQVTAETLQSRGRSGELRTAGE